MDRIDLEKLRRHRRWCTALWLSTAALAVVGVALGVWPARDGGGGAELGGIQLQAVGRALQLAGLTCAVAAWAAEERRARREQNVRDGGHA